MNREDIIRMAQTTGWDFGWEMTVEQVCEFADLIAAAEREACAKVCDDMAAHYWEKDDAIESLNCEECATAIRARGGN